MAYGCGCMMLVDLGWRLSERFPLLVSHCISLSSSDLMFISGAEEAAGSIEL